VELKQHEEAAVGNINHQDKENAMNSHRHIHVTVKLLPAGNEAKFSLPENPPLREVLQEGAGLLHLDLLPPAPLEPLDRLHDIFKHDEVGPAITNLDQSLGAYLDEKGTTPNFGIELVLAFRVNTRWAVATGPQMTPKQILALPSINLDYQQYTLYLPGSATPLPLDQEIPITRGEALEAQRDGKYGGQEK
jgi:hypothetical protein